MASWVGEENRLIVEFAEKLRKNKEYFATVVFEIGPSKRSLDYVVTIRNGLGGITKKSEKFRGVRLADIKRVSTSLEELATVRCELECLGNGHMESLAMMAVREAKILTDVELLFEDVCAAIGSSEIRAFSTAVDWMRHLKNMKFEVELYADFRKYGEFQKFDRVLLYEVISPLNNYLKNRYNKPLSNRFKLDSKDVAAMEKVISRAYLNNGLLAEMRDKVGLC